MKNGKEGEGERNLLYIIILSIKEIKYPSPIS